MLQTIGIFEAKTNLSKLLEKVTRLKTEIIITNRGKKIAKISAIEDNDNLNTLMREIGNFRKTHKMKLEQGETIKSLIEEGRH